jgi:hypothetical protein
MRFAVQSIRSLFLVFTALLVLSTSMVQSAFAEDVSEEDVPTAPAAAPSPNSIFGIQTYRNTGEGTREYEPLLETGATWLRVPFYWDRLEPTNVSPSEYRWSFVDGPAGAASAPGIKIILTVERSPSWAAPNSDRPINAANLADFAEMMAAVVERYDGDGIDDAPGSPVIEYFEFFNEPDGYCNGNRRWGDAGDEYAEMLKAVYGPMKQANPSAQIVFGGIAFDWFQDVDANGVCTPKTGWLFGNGPFAYNFLEDVLKAGGGDYFDVMNFHSYPAFAKNWTQHCWDQNANCVNGPYSSFFDFESTNQLSLGIYEKTLYIRKLMTEYGYGNMPIFITEAGIGSDIEGREDTGDSPYKIQSEHLVASFAQAKAANIASMIWWTLFDELPYRMGLIEIVNGQPVKKESFGVYQVAVDQLADAVFERNLTPNTGYPLRIEPIWLGYNDLSQYLQEPFTLEAYQFYHPGKGKVIYVAWVNSLLGKPLERTFTIMANQAVVRDIYGEVVTTLNDTDNDGQIQVAVDREPIYIEVTESRTYLYLPAVGR